jgi:hypothetical protein
VYYNKCIVIFVTKNEGRYTYGAEVAKHNTKFISLATDTLSRTSVEQVLLTLPEHLSIPVFGTSKYQAYNYISSETCHDSGPTDRYVTPIGHIILIPDQQIDVSPHSDTLS